MRHPKKSCSIEGCDKEQIARCLCRLHYEREWRALNRDKARARTRRWIKANPGMIGAYRRANPDRVREWNRSSYARHADVRRKTSQAWRECNAERMRELARIRRATNPDAVKAQVRERRARQLGAEGKFTASDWRSLVARSPNCYWCRKKFTRSRKPTHDHVLALINGGANNLENSVCACRKCNSRKGAQRINPVTGQGILL